MITKVYLYEEEELWFLSDQDLLLGRAVCYRNGCIASAWSLDFHISPASLSRFHVMTIP